MPSGKRRNTAYGDGLNAYRTDFCNRDKYYTSTYGSKGSDEVETPKINTWDDIFDNIESEMDCIVPLKVANYLEKHYMKPTQLQTDENGKPLTYWGGLDTSSQTTSDKWKEYQDWLNEVPEISDEEIHKAATNYSSLYYEFRAGASWYREQLKSRQC